MKILNLFAGIGGNRTGWGDGHSVTAVEFDPEIAEIYKHRFPNDTVIVDDAMEYCLQHYHEFDFIWASPPCPSHSHANRFLHAQGVRRYPDMRLYQLIVFLEFFTKYNGLDIHWCVENVRPYYKPLRKPAAELDRHFFGPTSTSRQKTLKNTGSVSAIRGRRPGGLTTNIIET